MAAIGPVPFCGMMLADMGADVVRLDRTASAGLGLEVAPKFDCMGRGKRSIALDLKQGPGLDVARRLLAAADIVIEGFRPGVMERLGLGPDVCFVANPKLIYGRCSGWGDRGPLAPHAGHDLNYVSLSGALAAIAPGGPPPPPLNLVGDFGGAAMHLVAGVLAALVARQRGGTAQVVTTSIAAGASGLMPMIYGLYAAGDWALAPDRNILDGGAPFYRCYETSDGRYMAVAAIEAKFYAELVRRLGLDGRIDLAEQNDRARWPDAVAILTARFRERSRAEWSALFAASDACVTPVLDMSEAPTHPQQVATGAFIDVGGVVQPACGVTFSNGPSPLPTASPDPGADSRAILRDLGYGAQDIEQLVTTGAAFTAAARH